MMATDTPPRIWIGCLAAYNDGSLHGEWVEASSDVEEMEEARARVLDSSPVSNAEEAMIFDHEGFPAGTIGEHSSMEEVAELIEAIGDAAEYVPLDAVHAYIANVGGMEYFDSSACEDSFAGDWYDGSEYAADLTEQCGDEIPAHLVHYIDYAAMYHDMQCGGEVWEADAGGGRVYIFRSF